MKFDLLKGDTVSTLLVWGLVIGAAMLAFNRGLFWVGLKESSLLFQNVFFRIAGALVLAGFAQVLVSPEYIGKILGYESSWKGIILGWLLGIVAPGGPFVSFPILAVLITKGASIASVFAFLSSWSLLGIFRILSWELPFFGWKLVVARILISFWVPLLLGFLTRFFIHR
jgi:uncharacterized membrane protein YraQ (UPF0718 family)